MCLQGMDACRLYYVVNAGCCHLTLAPVCRVCSIPGGSGHSGDSPHWPARGRCWLPVCGWTDAVDHPGAQGQRWRHLWQVQHHQGMSWYCRLTGTTSRWVTWLLFHRYNVIKVHDVIPVWHQPRVVDSFLSRFGFFKFWNRFHICVVDRASA